MILQRRGTFDDDIPCTPPEMKKPNKHTDDNISIPTLKKRCVETLNLCRNTSLTNEEIVNIIFSENAFTNKKSATSDISGLITRTDHYDTIKEDFW